MKPPHARKQAAALSYDSHLQQAPVLKAKGKGLAAEKIIEKATEHGIVIQEDAALVELLGQLEVNEAIPENLYEAAAEVFAFIYRLDKQLGDS